MRFNNAPVSGHEADVGSRTSVRYTNFIYEGLRESDEETIIAFWCKEPPCDRGALPACPFTCPTNRKCSSHRLVSPWGAI
jgi:hypothetical protein